jgi:ABC-type amino acid transport system permease subunit
MNILAAYGLLAHALIFGALTALAPLGDMRARVALAATTLALVVGIAPGMHAFFGTPSLTLLALAVLQLADKTPSPLGYRPALGLLAFAMPFYAASLGLGSFDPYALGYQPALLLAVLLPLGLALWWKRQDVWLATLAADLAGYASGVFANLWDVLLDPLLVLLALIIVGRQAVIRALARKIRPAR